MNETVWQFECLNLSTFPLLCSINLLPKIEPLPPPQRLLIQEQYCSLFFSQSWLIFFFVVQFLLMLRYKKKEKSQKNKPQSNNGYNGTLNITKEVKGQRLKRREEIPGVTLTWFASWFSGTVDGDFDRLVIGTNLWRIRWQRDGQVEWFACCVLWKLIRREGKERSLN